MASALHKTRRTVNTYCYGQRSTQKKTNKKHDCPTFVDIIGTTVAIKHEKILNTMGLSYTYC